MRIGKLYRSVRRDDADMKPLNKKLSVYTACAWVLTILALMFRLLARLFSYDTGIGYLSLLILLAVSALFTFRRESVPESVYSEMKETSVAEKIAAMIGAVCMVIVSISMALLHWVNGVILPNVLTFGGLLTAILSIFFFLFFWVPSRRGKTGHIFSAFALLLYFLYILSFSYFELYTPMNNPVKLLIQLSAIASIFFLLTDLRFRLGTPRPARFLFSALLVLAFNTVSVLSGSFFSVPMESYTNAYRIFECANLGILIYAAVRTVRFLTLCSRSELLHEDGISEEPKEIPESTDEIPAENISRQDTDHE